MFRYCATIFVSAFLLFQVQPMIARIILPWYGGTAAVWTTCLMFFQTTLVLGYFYAHALRHRLSPRTAISLHAVVLIAAALTINVQPSAQLAPDGTDNLTWSIVRLLASTIGPGFFALSATGPLIQSWQATTHPQTSTWRLYALSNLGSLLALPSYPLMFEPWLSLANQAIFWQTAFWLFAGLCITSSFQLLNHSKWTRSNPNPATSAPARMTKVQIAIWLLLAMAASMMLLASTNLMCQEIASFPFLWILPLSLYLISLIVCFDRPAWYRRDIFAALLIVSSFAGIALLHLNVFAGLLLQIAGLSTLCFAASMVCHGELVRLKPDPRDLTTFYLCVAIGGASGGIFVAVVAPRLFSGFYEFHIALLLCLLLPPLAVAAIGRAQTSSKEFRVLANAATLNLLWLMSVLCAAAFAVSSLMFSLNPAYHPDLVAQARNEYGLVSVRDRDGKRLFFHGRIEHGRQSLDTNELLSASGYYTAESGAGLAFRAMQQLKPDGIKVGVIGLGAGGMVAWTRPQDQLVFYELSPLVEKVAREHFDFLQQSPAQTSVVLGDGRVQLQQQFDENGSREFDLLFMDAFSSDSIPVHLLTDECFDLYFRHLNIDGMLVAHITNRFIDLRPVVYAAAEARGLEPLLIDYNLDQGKQQTRWVLIPAGHLPDEISWLRGKAARWSDDLNPVLWTDDNASIVPLIDWSTTIDWQQLLRHHREQYEE